MNSPNFVLDNAHIDKKKPDGTGINRPGIVPGQYLESLQPDTSIFQTCSGVRLVVSACSRFSEKRANRKDKLDSELS